MRLDRCSSESDRALTDGTHCRRLLQKRVRKVRTRASSLEDEPRGERTRLSGLDNVQPSNEQPQRWDAVGITASSASFRGDPPALEAIVAEIERLSGLALVVEPRSSGDLFRFNADIAFARVRRERVTVYAYVPGQKGMRELIMATPGVDALARDNPKVAKMIEAYTTAATPDPSVAHVHTMGYIGEEGSLHDFAAIALESLGGVLARPISQARRARCAEKLTPALLRARHRQHVRAWIWELLKAPANLLAAMWRRT